MSLRSCLLGGGLIILFICGCTSKSYVIRDIDNACAHAKELTGEDLSDKIPETLFPFGSALCLLFLLRSILPKIDFCVLS